MAEVREPVLRTSVIMARDLGVAPTSDRPTIAVASGDMVHWGSIWGGFLATAAIGLILSAFPVAFGVAPGQAPSTVWGAALAVLGGLVAVYLGALLTGFMSGVYNRICAGLNGAVLGCIAVVGTTIAILVGIQAARMAGLFPLTAFITPDTVTPAAMGSAWGYIVSALLMIGVGFLGGMNGEQLREKQIDREHDLMLAREMLGRETPRP